MKLEYSQTRRVRSAKVQRGTGERSWGEEGGCMRRQAAERKFSKCRSFGRDLSGKREKEIVHVITYRFTRFLRVVAFLPLPPALPALLLYLPLFLRTFVYSSAYELVDRAKYIRSFSRKIDESNIEVCSCRNFSVDFLSSFKAIQSRKFLQPWLPGR